MHTLAAVGMFASYFITIFLALAVGRRPARFARPYRYASAALGIIAGIYVAAANAFLNTRWLSSGVPFVILPLAAAQLLIFLAGLWPRRVAHAERAEVDNEAVAHGYSSAVQQPGRRSVM